MKTKHILSLVAAGFCFLALPSMAFAGERKDYETNRDENNKIVKGPYLTTHITKNWFIDLGVGPSIYLGGLIEDWGKGICPVIDLSVGKWLTPEMAVRIQGNYTPKFKQFYKGPETSTLYEGKELNFYYYSIHADFMWDLLTSFGGYRWNRVYHLIPFVGVGYSQLGESNYFPSVSHEFTLHGGAINKFRLCDWVDFNLEIRGSAANYHHDRIEQAYGTSIDVPFSVTGGFTFNIGRREFQRASTYAAEKVSAAVAEKDAQLAALAAAKAATDAANAALIKELDALKNAKPDTVVVEKAGKANLEDVIVFFELDKAVLTDQEDMHFKSFVYYVKYAIASGDNVVLVGSCDKQTGTAKYNKKLSKRRADFVKKLLVEEYGLPADRIEAIGEGGTTKFKKQALNRNVTVRVQ